MYKDVKGKWVADLGNGKYRNPILFSDYSDPDVIRVGEDFFMVASSFTYFPGLPVLHSKDLVNWQIVSYGVQRLPFDCYDKPQHGKGVWAPSIRYHDGIYYIYFATPDEGIFMVHTDNPFGQWSEVVTVCRSLGWIDPCPFWDEDGKAYLIRGVARTRCGIKSQLFLHRMKEDGTALLDEGVRVFDGRINHPTIEGPKMYKRNGYYYILAPAGGVRTGWQMAARSKDIYGPYEHRILMHQGDTPVNGPHQGGLVDLDNGESWFIHFQDLETYGRVTHLQPARWVDDWPEIGIDTNNDKVGEPVMEYTKPSTPQQGELIMPLENDRFDGVRLGNQWQWQAHARDSFYELDNRRLRLFALPIEGEQKLLSEAPNLLSQLIHSPNLEIRTRIKLSLNNGDCCGLCITGGNYYAIEVEKQGGKHYIKALSYEYDSALESKAGESVLGNILVKIDISQIYLKIRMEYPGKITFHYSYDGDNYGRLGVPCEYHVSRKSWVGGRVGIYCVNKKDENTGGYVDFKSITIE